MTILTMPNDSFLAPLYGACRDTGLCHLCYKQVITAIKGKVEMKAKQQRRRQRR